MLSDGTLATVAAGGEQDGVWTRWEGHVIVVGYCPVVGQDTGRLLEFNGEEGIIRGMSVSLVIV
jgi:hypothetical protein